VQHGNVGWIEKLACLLEQGHPHRLLNGGAAEQPLALASHRARKRAPFSPLLVTEQGMRQDAQEDPVRLGAEVFGVLRHFPQRHAEAGRAALAAPSRPRSGRSRRTS
jgi:hypothetical protein